MNQMYVEWNGMVWDDVISTPCTNIPCKIYSKHFKSLKSIIYAVDLNAKVPKQLLPVARCCVFIKLFVVTLTSYSNRFSVKWRPCLPLPAVTYRSKQSTRYKRNLQAPSVSLPKPARVQIRCVLIWKIAFRLFFTRNQHKSTKQQFHTHTKNTHGFNAQTKLIIVKCIS